MKIDDICFFDKINNDTTRNVVFTYVDMIESDSDEVDREIKRVNRLNNINGLLDQVEDNELVPVSLELNTITPTFKTINISGYNIIPDNEILDNLLKYLDVSTSGTCPSNTNQVSLDVRLDSMGIANNSTKVFNNVRRIVNTIRMNARSNGDIVVIAGYKSYIYLEGNSNIKLFKSNLIDPNKVIVIQRTLDKSSLGLKVSRSNNMYYIFGTPKTFGTSIMWFTVK